jgi:adenylate kinase
VRHKVVLLTGVPGVGKSFVAAELERLFEPLTVIGFSSIIQDQRPDQPSIRSLRTDPDRYARSEDIDSATTELARRLEELRSNSNVLIDSHAVARTAYGFRITPDSVQTLQMLQLDAVLVLHDSPAAVIERTTADAQGRRPSSPDDVAHHASLQDSVSVAYGISSPCPVFVVNRGSNLDNDVQSIASILLSVGASIHPRGA